MLSWFLTVVYSQVRGGKTAFSTKVLEQLVIPGQEMTLNLNSLAINSNGS